MKKIMSILNWRSPENNTLTNKKVIGTLDSVAMRDLELRIQKRIEEGNSYKGIFIDKYI